MNMPDTLLPVSPHVAARFTEVAPALLTVEAAVNPNRDFRGPEIVTALTGILTVENSNNIIRALQARELGAACVAGVSAAFWGLITAYNVRDLSGQQMPEYPSPTKAQVARGLGIVAGLIVGQRFVNHRLGK